MMKMKIKLNEEKAKENDKYTVDEMYRKIDELAKSVNIVKKEGKYMYLGNNDRYDFAGFGRMIIALGQCDWFKRNISEWLWYDGNEIDDIIDFYRDRRDVV